MTDDPTPPAHALTVPRTARYYSLGGEEGAREVWIVLHGFSQLAGRFVRWFRPAVTPHRRIVAPEALNRFYVSREPRRVGATWMTSEDRLAEIADYVRYLDLLAVEVVPEGVPLQVHGFSQGAATAARWVAFGRTRVQRLVLWGGLLPPDLELEPNRRALAAADLTYVIGDRDEHISAQALADESARLAAAGIPHVVRGFRGVHTIPWPEVEQFARGEGDLIPGA